MIVKRLSNYIVTVDHVVFEYNHSQAVYVDDSGTATDQHYAALNHFLMTESPEAQEHYRAYFKFLDHLAQLLKERNICSEL